MTTLLPAFSQLSVPDTTAGSGVLHARVTEADGVNLWWYGWVLRKQWRPCAVVFFATICLVGVITFLQTPLYTAETMLLIEERVPQVLNIEHLLNIEQVLAEPQSSVKSNYLETQYEILKSRSLAAQVIREQSLEKSPALTGTRAHARGPVFELWHRVRTWLKAQHWIPDFFFRFLSPQAQTTSAGRVDPRLIDTYTDDMLKVEPIGKTHLLQVSFSTPDPALSARLANAHAQAYIYKGLALRTGLSQEARRFLEEKVGELKTRMELSASALKDYRRTRGIISLDDKENLVVERLSDLHTRLTEAEAERIALEAHVRLIHKKAYQFLPAVINHPLIQTLKTQLVRLQGEYTRLSTRLKPNFPYMAQLKAQMEDMQSRLQAEIQLVVNGVESSFLAAEAKEKELATKMEAQKAAALSLKDASVEYTLLSREVETNRQLYDDVLQRLKELDVATELHVSNVFVIDEAVPPLDPHKPKKKRNLLLGVFLGLLGGVGLAFFREYLDNTFKTPAEVEHDLHLPILAVMPDLFRFHGHGRSRLPQPLASTREPRRPVSQRNGLQPKWRKPAWGARPAEIGLMVSSYHAFSRVAEAYRTLHTAIQLSSYDARPPKTILFTSGKKGEGKTTTVINTAISAAQIGAKALVVDADLRHPCCHHFLGGDTEYGLADVLSGHRELQDVIQPTHTDNLFFINAGWGCKGVTAAPSSPAALVHSNKMHETFNTLRERYDYVFVDSPPVVLISDTGLLATMVDGVVLVVDSQQTPRHVAREALLRLNYARAQLIGVVLNRVDMSSGVYAYYHNHYYSSPDTFISSFGIDI